MPFDPATYVEAPAPVTSPAAILLRAAEIVEQGWCQWLLEDAHGNVCARGALQKAIYGKAGGGPIPEGIYNALAPLTGCWMLAAWNDHPLRTAAEVASKMRAAARRVE